MLSVLVSSIKPFVRTEPWFGPLTRELSVISGLDGGVDPGFGLVDIFALSGRSLRTFVGTASTDANGPERTFEHCAANGG